MTIPVRPPRSIPTQRARSARVAVSALFLINGAIFANVVPRFPELKTQLGLSNGQLGLSVAAGPLGALIIGLLASALIKRWGSAKAAVGGAVVMACNLLLIGVAPNWILLTLGLFIAGGCDSIADVGNNAHGLRVQRLYGRSIVNAFHGLWSVGAVVGGLIGAAAAQLEIPIMLHLGVVMIIFGGAALYFRRLMLDGHEDSERSAAAEHRTAAGRRIPARTLRTLLLLGLVAGAASIVEDSGNTWGAVYLRNELGTIPIVAGLGFVGLQGMQTIGRLLGDRVVNRIGERLTAQIGGLLVLIGMGPALAWPHPVTTVIGFSLAGLGIATMIPTAMHASDEVPGLWPGAGLTVVAWISRIGFLISPPVVGFIADATTLRTGLLIVPVAGVLAIISAVALAPRRTDSP